ncbi:MAG: acetate/propionate family kinase [Gammaproteobacteria bacterium]|nr:acetate/propionate family kinase [Gammaproteobacteria bacterium]
MTAQARRAADPGDLLLVLNAGSSSLKFALHEPLELRCEYRGSAEGGNGRGRIEIAAAEGEPWRANLEGDDFQRSAFAALFDWLNRHALTERLSAAGHRVVHGGVEFTAPLLVDDANLARMDDLVLLAPLHLPQNLSAIHLLADLKPDLPRVACFDTAFHAVQSPMVRTYGLPAHLTRQGYIRYGFHGLSYEYIASCLGTLFGDEAARARVVVAHLGNGASLCAMKDRTSVATTFGYSTLDGLIMGTRCGALDPGLVLQLIRDHGGDADFVEAMLYKESGMLGVSGIASDMRALLASDDPQAAFAVDMFVYRIVRECGSLAAALGGIDAIVFTGGIGARSAPVRARVCEGLQWLGASIDRERNESGAARIEAPGSSILAAAVPTNEELVIARHTRDLVYQSAGTIRS